MPRIFSSAYLLLWTTLAGAVHIEHRPDSELPDEANGEWCPAWKSLVCASDGVTYWNECAYVKNKAKNPELGIISSGACAQVECDDCINDGTSKLRICASNNMLMSKPCQLTCLLEDYPMAKESFYGCKGGYPTVREMELATSDMFTTMVEQLLKDALPPAPPTSGKIRHKRNVQQNQRDRTTSTKEPLQLGQIIGDKFAKGPPFDNENATTDSAEKDNTAGFQTDLNHYQEVEQGNKDIGENPSRRSRRQEEDRPSKVINATKTDKPEVVFRHKKDILAAFSGYIYNDGMQFRISAKNGWMDEISWVTAPESFVISAEKQGRLKYRLSTGALHTGYEYFTVTAGQNKTKTKMNLTLNNASLVLVADATANMHNCTRLVPVTVKLYDLPSIQVQATEINLPENFPKNDLDGFIKEKFVQRINDAIENNLYKRMHRIGCLNWDEKVNGTKCFGAFQTRFCSSS